MPEGHTLHRLAGQLTDVFAGHRVHVSSPQGRFAADAALVDRTELVGAEAWGKQLFVEFADERLVHVHLGLIGRFDVVAGPLAPPVGQVRLRLVRDDGGAYADLRGATRCDLVGPARRTEVAASLGPDPLRTDADPERAWRRISTSDRTIGDLLMDQSVLAGVGNVYRAEVLFRHHMHPLRPGRTLRRSQFAAIWADLTELMTEGSVPDASTPSDPSTRRRRWGVRRARTTTAVRCMSIVAPAWRAWSAEAPCAPRDLPDATRSGAPVASRSSAHVLAFRVRFAPGRRRSWDVA